MNNDTPAPRDVAMLLTDDDAKLLQLLLGLHTMQILRHDPTNAQAQRDVERAAELVVMLQTQRELAQQQRDAGGVHSDLGQQLDGDELAARARDRREP